MPYSITPAVFDDPVANLAWFENAAKGDTRLMPQDTTPDGGSVIVGAATGRRILPVNIPTKIGFRDAHPTKGQLCDFEKSKVCMMISNAAKDVIEWLEPGVHQFFPVEVHAYADDPATWDADAGIFAPAKGRKRTDRKIADHWFFVICHRLDALNPDLSIGVTQYGFYAPGLLKAEGKLDGDPKLVLNRAAIGEAKIWCDKFIPQHFFMSDDVVAAADAAGLTGLHRTFIDAV